MKKKIFFENKYDFNYIMNNFLFTVIISLHNVYHKYVITKATYMQAAPKYFQEYYPIYRFLDT